MKLSCRWGGAVRAVTAGLLALALGATPALACTQVYVGSGLTANGDVYWGRSEDFANRYAKAFGIEPASPTGKLLQSYENGSNPAASFSYQIATPTFRYTYVRDTPENWTTAHDAGAKAYSEAGTNEKGVSVSTTLSTSMNAGVAAIDPLVGTGIGEYSLADFVLSQARTAREGVELLGKVIDERGSQGCNQIVIGDAAETWIFQQLSGHQWIAIKPASDVVSVNPNMDDLQFVANFGDSATCLHSADLVETAKKAGSYVESDGAMNVAASYGNDSVSQGVGQNTRYVQGQKYFGVKLVAGIDYTLDWAGVVTIANPQLFFKPPQKLDTFAILRSVAARGEGTDVDANANPALYAIGNDRNSESHIFQVRAALAADPTVATIQWTALSRAEFSLFVPSYSALLAEVDSRLYPSEDAFDIGHMGFKEEYDDRGAYLPERIAANEKTALEGTGGGALDYVFMDLNTLAYNHRDVCAEGVRAYLNALQKDIIEQQEVVDGVMTAASSSKRTELANAAFRRVSDQAQKKAGALLGELRSYVKAGDFSKPFASSDLGEDGTLTTPMLYADSVVAPTITVQPQAVTCLQGEKATLAAAATEKDGAKGSDALLAYQWFKNGEAIEGATGASLVADTSAVGSADYKVRVTNAAGLFTESDVVRVAVSERVAPKPDPEPQQGGGGETKPTDASDARDAADGGAKKAAADTSKSGGKLAQTGDELDLAAPLAVACSGVLIVGAGVALRRRQRWQDKHSKKS